MHLEELLGLRKEDNLKGTMMRENEDFGFSGVPLNPMMSIGGDWEQLQVENTNPSPVLLSPNNGEANQWDQINSVFQYPADPYYSESGNLYSPGSTGSEVLTPTWMNTTQNGNEYSEFSDEVLKNQRLPPVETAFSFSRPFGNQGTLHDFQDFQVW